jgi:S1-C subfamily serine protease
VKKVIALSLLLVVSLVSLACADDLKPEEIYKSSLPATMVLDVDKESGSSLGTAFLAIKDGVAVTAWHVVRGAKSVKAKFSDGQTYDCAGLIDRDERRDVALVRVKVFGRKLLTLATAKPEIGSAAYAIGAPVGYEFSISNGIVSQLRTEDSAEQYQITTPISPGNSGGPLLNAKGDVIGVVVAMRTDAQNLNFASPSTAVLALDATLPVQPWDSVKSTMSADDDFYKLMARCQVALADADMAWTYAYEADAVPQELYKAKKDLEAVYDDLKGVATPLSLDGKAVDYYTDRFRGMYEAIDLLIKAKRLSVNGEGRRSRDALDEANEAYSLLYDTDHDMPKDVHDGLAASKVFLSGIPGHLLFMFDPEGNQHLTGALVPSSDPLTVMWVLSGSAASRAGLKPHDRFVSAEGKTVHSVREVADLLHDTHGKAVKVIVLRNGKETELKIKAPR